jgi:hypothetical protein
MLSTQHSKPAEESESSPNASKLRVGEDSTVSYSLRRVIRLRDGLLRAAYV